MSCNWRSIYIILLQLGLTFGKWNVDHEYQLIILLLWFFCTLGQWMSSNWFPFGHGGCGRWWWIFKCQVALSWLETVGSWIEYLFMVSLWKPVVEELNDRNWMKTILLRLVNSLWLICKLIGAGWRWCQYNLHFMVTYKNTLHFVQKWRKWIKDEEIFGSWWRLNGKCQ